MRIQIEWCECLLRRFSCWSINHPRPCRVGGGGCRGTGMPRCSVCYVAVGVHYSGRPEGRVSLVKSTPTRYKAYRTVKVYACRTELRLHQTRAAHCTPRYRRASPSRHSNHRHDQSRQSLQRHLIRAAHLLYILGLSNDVKDVTDTFSPNPSAQCTPKSCFRSAQSPSHLVHLQFSGLQSLEVMHLGCPRDPPCKALLISLLYTA